MWIWGLSQYMTCTHGHPVPPAAVHFDRPVASVALRHEASLCLGAGAQWTTLCIGVREGPGLPQPYAAPYDAREICLREAAPRSGSGDRGGCSGRGGCSSRFGDVLNLEVLAEDKKVGDRRGG